MNQVGDSKVFSLAPPAPAPGVVYSYVWKWWDGTTEATTAPWAQKEINIGGQPGASNTRKLLYSCTPVMPDGQNAVIYGEVIANNPPVIVAPVQVSANDRYFPYNTTLKVKAFDFDGDAITAFEWSENGVVLDTGTGSAAGNVSATWKGNNTSVTASYPAFERSFTLTVTGPRVLLLKVKDAQGGVTQFEVELRGQVPPPAAVVGGGVQGVTATWSAFSRVGPGVVIDFEIYARDPSGRPIVPSWNFAGTHGWTVELGPSPGLVTTLPDGGIRSVQSKNISGELFPLGDRKTVTALVTLAWPGGHSEVKIPTTLLANHAPTAISFSAKVNGDDYAWASGTPIDRGDTIEFSAKASDPDMDLVTYFWTIVQPPNALPPVTMHLWGPKAILDTLDWPTSTKVTATCVATDRFGAKFTEVTPGIPVSPAQSQTPDAFNATPAI